MHRAYMRVRRIRLFGSRRDDSVVPLALRRLPRYVCDDTEGRTGVQSNVVTITAVAPTASFTAACNSHTCAVDGTASSDADGTISSYAWNFGDGGAGSGPTASHTYTAPGNYTITLTVS